MESNIGKVRKHLEELGLTLAINKTQMCVFSYKNKAYTDRVVANRKMSHVKRTHQIKIQNEVVSASKTVNFLGMILQSDLVGLNRSQQTSRNPMCLLPSYATMLGKNYVGSGSRSIATNLSDVN